MQSISKNKPSYLYKKASFQKRLAAFYLALLIIAAFSYLFSYLVSETGILEISLYSKEFWFLFSVLLLFGFITDGFFKSILTFNLAYLFLGIRLVDERDFKSIGFIRAVMRTIISFFSFLIGGLGFFAILFNREKLSMHDMLVRSSVVDLSESLIFRVISALVSFFIAIPGLIITLSLLFILVSSPLLLWDSVKDYQKQQSIEISEWLEKSNAQYTVEVNDKEGSKQVTFLIADLGIYKENFTVLPNQKFSTVDINEIDLLDNLTKVKFDLENFMSSTDFLESFYIKFDKIVFKTTANYDLSIRNPKFYFASENILANDLLSTFNYNLVEQSDKLKFKLSKNLTMVLSNKKLSYMMKSDYIKSVYYIENQWTKYLSSLDVKAKAKLDENKDKLTNNIRIFIDSSTGYIQRFDIVHPGKNALFNKSCNEFLNTLQFKVLDIQNYSPSELEDAHFEMILSYRDRI